MHATLITVKNVMPEVIWIWVHIEIYISVYIGFERELVKHRNLGMATNKVCGLLWSSPDCTALLQF